MTSTTPNFPLERVTLKNPQYCMWPS